MDWLFVGLGNPGARYAGTRHNIGRDVVEAFAARHGVALDTVRGPARTASAQVGDRRVGLLVPTCYMNESGRAVGPIARFFKVEPARIVVVYDDIDLPLGRLRLRAEGGAGGHNGMRDIQRVLGGAAVPRLRLGVGRPPAGWDAADHVLARFAREERDDADALVAAALDVLEDITRSGLEAAMNRANAG